MSSSSEAEDAVEELTREMVRALETTHGEEEEVQDKEQEGKSKTLGTCAACSTLIEREASVVGNERFHPNCFCCAKCSQPLGAEQFFIINGKNYCAKDKDAFLEQCTRCSQTIHGDLIRPKETGLPFHPDCFTCDNCSKRIDGKYYDLDGKTVCEEDWRASRDRCNRCSEPIVGTVLKAVDRSFHPACFTCSECPLCLDGIQFYMADEGEPLCELCYARTAAKRCNGCQEPIVEDCLVSKNTGDYFHKKCYTRA